MKRVMLWKPFQQSSAQKDSEATRDDLRPTHHESEHVGHRCWQVEHPKNQLRASEKNSSFEERRKESAAARAEREDGECEKRVSSCYDRNHRSDGKLPLKEGPDGQQHADDGRPPCARPPDGECHDHVEQAANQEHIDRARYHRHQKAEALEQKRKGKKHRELASLFSFHLHETSLPFIFSFYRCSFSAAQGLRFDCFQNAQ